MGLLTVLLRTNRLLLLLVGLFILSRIWHWYRRQATTDKLELVMVTSKKKAFYRGLLCTSKIPSFWAGVHWTSDCTTRNDQRTALCKSKPRLLWLHLLELQVWLLLQKNLVRIVSADLQKRKRKNWKEKKRCVKLKQLTDFSFIYWIQREHVY